MRPPRSRTDITPRTTPPFTPRRRAVLGKMRWSASRASALATRWRRARRSFGATKRACAPTPICSSFCATTSSSPTRWPRATRASSSLAGRTSTRTRPRGPPLARSTPSTPHRRTCAQTGWLSSRARPTTISRPSSGVGSTASSRRRTRTRATPTASASRGWSWAETWRRRHMRRCPTQCASPPLPRSCPTGSKISKQGIRCGQRMRRSGRSHGPTRRRSGRATTPRA
mmetsp:Transcript_15933/g.52521  ORF Transcript_15933/g.52521 Transcript_15933/m.52521 type:complete len:228 (+) Transcript_15933:1140-1823(+)